MFEKRQPSFPDVEWGLSFFFLDFVRNKLPNLIQHGRSSLYHNLHKNNRLKIKGMKTK
jgi:hypothetical protein